MILFFFIFTFQVRKLRPGGNLSKVTQARGQQKSGFEPRHSDSRDHDLNHPSMLPLWQIRGRVTAEYFRWEWHSCPGRKIWLHVDFTRTITMYMEFSGHRPRGYMQRSESKYSIRMTKTHSINTLDELTIY